MKNMSISEALMWLIIATILSKLSFLLAILGIAALLMNLLALFSAGRRDRGYMTAFFLSIISIVVVVVGAIFQKVEVISSLFNILTLAINLGVLYFVVKTTNGQLTEIGASEVVEKSYAVWKLNLICTVAAMVLTVLQMIVPALARTLAIAVTIVEIVAAILYMIYLYKSSKALA